jgi:hypothetical protein
MTTETLIRHAHATPAPGLAERSTGPLAPGEPALDAVAFLDHRLLGRTIAPRLAIPGHYLALGAGSDAPLLAIHEGVAHVGRSVGAEIRFEEPHLSRRHAILTRYGHHLRALDDRSSEGTFVNGMRIVAVDLRAGDVLRLGRLVLRYVRVS